MDLMLPLCDFTCSPFPFALSSIDDSYYSYFSGIESCEFLRQSNCNALTSSALCSSNYPTFTDQVLDEDISLLEATSTLLQQSQSNVVSGPFDSFLSLEGPTVSDILGETDLFCHIVLDKVSECDDTLNSLLQVWSKMQKRKHYCESSCFCSECTSLTNSIASSSCLSNTSGIEQINCFHHTASGLTNIGNGFNSPEGRRSLYIDLIQQIKRASLNWATHEKSFNYHFYALLKCRQLKDFAEYDAIFEHLLVHRSTDEMDKVITYQTSTIINPALQQSPSSNVGLPNCSSSCMPIYLKLIEELDKLRLLQQPKFQPLDIKELSENIFVDDCLTTNSNQTTHLNAKLSEADSCKHRTAKNETFNRENEASYVEVKDGLMHGHGQYRFSDGSIYDGQWINNSMQGYGRLATTSGKYYEGQFHHSKLHGEGTYGEPNGIKYVGTWKEGLLDGHAKRVSTGNIVQHGEWQKGRFIRWTSEKFDNEVDQKKIKTFKLNTTSAVRLQNAIKRNACRIKNLTTSPPRDSGSINLLKTTAIADHNGGLDHSNDIVSSENRFVKRPKNMQLKAWINEAKRLPRHPQVNFNKVLGRWYAIIKNPKTGKRTWKGFSCSIYGFKKARQMAIDWVNKNRSENFDASAKNAEKYGTTELSNWSYRTPLNERAEKLGKSLKVGIPTNNVNAISCFVAPNLSKKLETAVAGTIDIPLAKNIRRSCTKETVAASLASDAQQKNRQHFMQLFSNGNNAKKPNSIKTTSKQNNQTLNNGIYVQNNIDTFHNSISQDTWWGDNVMTETNVTNIFQGQKSSNNAGNAEFHVLSNASKCDTDDQSLNIWNNKSSNQENFVRRRTELETAEGMVCQSSPILHREQSNNDSTMSFSVPFSQSSARLTLPHLFGSPEQNQEFGDSQMRGFALSQSQMFSGNQTTCYSHQNVNCSSFSQQQNCLNLHAENQHSLSPLMHHQMPIQAGESVKSDMHSKSKKKKKLSEINAAWLRQDHWGKGWRCVWIDENGTQRSKFFGESKWGKEGCKQKAENYIQLASQIKFKAKSYI